MNKTDIKANIKTDILNAFHFRHACREFDPAKTISDDDFRFILETGRLSPSSLGYEPWHFLVLQDRALREKILPYAWGARRQLPTASHFVILLSRTKAGLEPEGEYITHIMKNVRRFPEDDIKNRLKRYMDFLENDIQVWDSERAVFDWASRQTYIALGNMMTAAAMIGIDSCPIEGFNKNEVERVLEAEGILDRSQFGISCMAAFGYRAAEAPAKTRRPLEEVAQWV